MCDNSSVRLSCDSVHMLQTSHAPLACRRVDALHAAEAVGAIMSAQQEVGGAGRDAMDTRRARVCGLAGGSGRGTAKSQGEAK